MRALSDIQVVEAYLADHNPELIAEDAVLNDHGGGEVIVGVDAIEERLYHMYEVVFPGAEARLKSLAGSDGVVAVEFDFVGTNSGPFFGAPPTGQDVSVPMCAIYEVESGRIQSIGLYYDSLTLTGQLGLVG